MDSQNNLSEHGLCLDKLHGSAYFAKIKEVQESGLCSDRGIYQGLLTMKGPSICLPKPRDTLLIGSSGSGKKSDTLVEQVLTCPYPLYVADPSHRIAPITLSNQANLGKRAYCFLDESGRLEGPPWFLQGVAVNPLSVLTPNHPKLHQRIVRVVECLLEGPADRISALEQERNTIAVNWLVTLVEWRIRSNNSLISLPALSQLINRILSDPRGWDQILTSEFQNARVAAYRRLATEMRIQRNRYPDKYVQLLARIQSALEPVNTSTLVPRLSSNGLSMQQIVETNSTFYNLSRVPALQRLLPVTLMFALEDKGGVAPFLFIMDKRAELGKFETAENTYIEAQPRHFFIEETWECLSQIKRVVGEASMNLKVSRASIQQYFGVGTFTANQLSRRLGMATVRYKSSRAKMQDDQLNASITLAMLNDEDPLESVVRANAQKKTYDYQARHLLKPEEIENMPSHRQILLVKGSDYSAIYGFKKSYKAKPYLLGRYLADPEQAAVNVVEVIGMDKRRSTFPLKISSVPEQWQHLPQYASGYRTLVELPLGLREVAEKNMRRLFHKLRSFRNGQR